uniref:Uncharacterized protein n=1 Tax=Anguilla anguilla TaxID=7936 RepID=A0A0E9SF21_ANGAN
MALMGCSSDLSCFCGEFVCGLLIAHVNRQLMLLDCLLV